MTTFFSQYHFYHIKTLRWSKQNMQEEISIPGTSSLPWRRSKMCTASGISQRTTCLTASFLRNGTMKVQQYLKDVLLMILDDIHCFEYLTNLESLCRDCHRCFHSTPYQGRPFLRSMAKRGTSFVQLETLRLVPLAPQPLLVVFSTEFWLHICFEDRGVVMENRLIGLPRLRQLKVTNTSCNIPEDFRGIIRRCYSRLADARIPLPLFVFFVQVHPGWGR